MRKKFYFMESETHPLVFIKKTLLEQKNTLHVKYTN